MSCGGLCLLLLSASQWKSSVSPPRIENNPNYHHYWISSKTHYEVGGSAFLLYPLGSTAVCSTLPSWGDVWTGPCFRGPAAFATSSNVPYFFIYVDKKNCRKSIIFSSLESALLPETLQRGLLWSPKVQGHHSLAEQRVGPGPLWRAKTIFKAAGDFRDFTF